MIYLILWLSSLCNVILAITTELLSPVIIPFFYLKYFSWKTIKLLSRANSDRLTKYLIISVLKPEHISKASTRVLFTKSIDNDGYKFTTSTVLKIQFLSSHDFFQVSNSSKYLLSLYNIHLLYFCNK